MFMFMLVFMLVFMFMLMLMVVGDMKVFNHCFVFHHMKYESYIVLDVVVFFFVLTYIIMKGPF